MSELVEHAKRELATIGEDEHTIEGFVRVVQAWETMGHSGASASIAIPMLTAILQFQNLSPLTDSPDEWHFHGDFDGWVSDEEQKQMNFWQNKRNGEAFSHDGGKTYYLISEGGNAGSFRDGTARMHQSRPARQVVI